ncbi:hypothetical protein ACFYTQ_21035 [Nocardia sp. NPDC004068]|uniref:mechanosensitive ion channel family protein n=1 Tax=Nocardia sp. NPDC004068 TaxID=3364303 RepID=UPI0036A98BE1
MYTSSLAIDFQQGMSNAWSSIATWVPKFIGFLVVLVIGWIVAKVVARIAGAILRRIGFDRLVERGGIKDMLARSRYDATDILVKLVYYAILLIALQIGFGVFGPNPVSDMLNGIVSWLPRAAVAIIIVVIAGAIARAVSDLVSNMLSGLSYGRMLGRIAAVFIWGVGIIAALNQIGVATSVTMPILITVLATIGGVLVVGVGGGLVRPMQRRWDGWLDNLEGEMPQLRGHAEAYQRGREDVSRQREMSHEQESEHRTPQMAGGASYGSEQMGRGQMGSMGYGSERGDRPGAGGGMPGAQGGRPGAQGGPAGMPGGQGGRPGMPGAQGGPTGMPGGQGGRPGMPGPQGGGRPGMPGGRPEMPGAQGDRPGTQGGHHGHSGPTGDDPGESRR